MKKIVLILSLLFIEKWGVAQSQVPFSITGSAGVTYENYGLNVNPSGAGFYTPRRPWNQLRFNIAPTFKFGKDFSLPVNFNFAAFPTNIVGPYAGITALGNQNFLQFLNNPLNNFSINPKYKWAELQLGTQYLNYSELTTGDIGVFGAGVNLKPKGFIFKCFIGTSQQGINHVLTPTPGSVGAYRRKHWMASIGKEKEGKYKILLNMAKGKDDPSSVTLPPVLAPKEGFVMSVSGQLKFKKAYFIEGEVGQSIYTTDITTPLSGVGGVKSFAPFIQSHTSTQKDYAAIIGIGRKSTNFDIGLKGKYIGAGYQTMGYPFQQPDRLEVTINTRFNAWKDKNGTYKTNVVASVGNRINNFNNTPLRANQFIGNINCFTQFNDKWSLNVNYNNFGFNTNGLATVKNVSNDFGINPTYTRTTKTMIHLFSLNYNFSQYDEYSLIASIPSTTHNNTHSILLTYVPTFFNRKITPDFSVLYFLNQLPGFNMNLFAATIGASGPLFNNKIKLRGQIQFTNGKNGNFSHYNNLIAGMNVDYSVTKKLKWTASVNSNYFKYGNELGVGLIGANYLESTIKTGLLYKWK